MGTVPFGNHIRQIKIELEWPRVVANSRDLAESAKPKQQHSINVRRYPESQKVFSDLLSTSASVELDMISPDSAGGWELPWVGAIFRSHADILKLSNVTFASPTIMTVSWPSGSAVSETAVKLTFPHYQDVSTPSYACGLWDGSKFDIRANICHLTFANTTHSECACAQGGHFALMSAPRGVVSLTTATTPVADDENQQEMSLQPADEMGNDHQATVIIVIITVSCSVVVVTLLGAAITAVYCKRIQVRAYFAISYRIFEHSSIPPYYLKTCNYIFSYVQ